MFLWLPHSVDNAFHVHNCNVTVFDYVVHIHTSVRSGSSASLLRHAPMHAMLPIEIHVFSVEQGWLATEM
jgi:hypothetical protein